MTVEPLTKRRLCLLSLRSLLLQCSWNFKQFQGLGWVYLLLPELRRLYPDRALRPIVQRYLGYFNSNVFLTPTIAAAVLALERRQRLEEPIPMSPQAFTEAVMAPFAAAGDAFFWGGLRPLCCALAVTAGSLGYWWSPVLFLVLFNLPVLFVRLIGPWLGYQQGVMVVQLLQRYRIADVALVLKRLAVVVLGGVAAVLCHQTGPLVPCGAVMVPVVLAGVIGCTFLLRQGIPLYLVVFALLGCVGVVDHFFL
nr:PTS system mannose/fructose/sorbose family transporter subunit IID [uncultured Desulfuromonas sp.]